MENNQKTHHNSDELDPFNLLEKALLYVRQFWKPLVIFSVLGLSLGLTSYLVSPRQYASRMLLQSRVLTNKEQIEIIESWRDLLKNREYRALAGIMQTDEAVVRGLKKIKADEIQKLYIQNNPNGFYVDVMVTDTAILDRLSEGIMSGLEHSRYVKEKVESKKLFFRQMIDNISNEIAKLESNKAVVDSLIRHGASNTSSLMVDISSLNGQWIGLNEKLLSFREELRFTRAVQLLQPFVKTSKPASAGLLKSVVLGTAAGFFLGYVISIFLYTRHRLRIRTRVRRAGSYAAATPE